MARIDFSALYEQQSLLDTRIHAQNHVDYPITMSRRVLALLVELGELANETRTFKFWSTKGPSPKAKILDEYADGLHFLLSLGLALKTSTKVFSYRVSKKTLTEQFLRCYHDFSELAEALNQKRYEKAMSSYLSLIPALGVTQQEVVDAYLTKLAINFKRQDEKY